MDCEHKQTRIIKADDTENRNGAVIEGLTEVRCADQVCFALLEIRA